MGTTRREEICEAALDLAAEGGNRAVTHHAIDDKLGLSRGSTSYYYRTRQQLLTAAIEHLTLASRSAYREALGTEPPPGALVDAAADLIARQVDKLLADRRRDVADAAMRSMIPTIGQELAKLNVSLAVWFLAYVDSDYEKDKEKQRRPYLELLNNVRDDHF